MANFTAELRTLVESGVNIFGFQYDFYDEGKRAEFERNFIRHFYFREIGCETVERFRWYLEDKMRTVFPYYNELFKAAQIEYNILDNYNVKEEYRIERKGLEKANNVSSTVGRASDNQTSETNDWREGTSNSDTTGTNGGTVTETVSTESTDTENTHVKHDVDGTQTTDMSVLTIGQKTVHNERKFLDTPQGQLDLVNSKYLTDLTDVKETTEDNTKQDTDGTVTNDTSEITVTQGSKNTDSDTNRNVTTNDTLNHNTKNTDKTEGTSSSVFNGEHKLTHDNNTRTEKVGDHVETSVYTKKGNIGIDTDSDMITKHINLQKVLRNIERMFFDECEDLFMMVYC